MCFKREIWEIKREIWEIKHEIWEIKREIWEINVNARGVYYSKYGMSYFLHV